MSRYHGAKVLVVDDETLVCELMCRNLRTAGYLCTAALSGEEALRKLEEESFDLVVADIMMPGMSGLDLLHIVKSLFPDVAVLMVTAVDDLSTGMNAVALGAYGYILKPFASNELLVNVAAALERRRAALERSGEGPASSVAVQQDSAPGRKIIIPAREVVDAVKSGMSDATLIDTFRLTPESLYTLFQKLVDSGKLTSDEVLARSELSANTVTIDMAELKLPEPGPAPEKSVIKAREAASHIRAGMSDTQLMKRYSISAKGLQSLFRKLAATGLITEEELDARRLQPSQLCLVDDEC